MASVIPIIFIGGRYNALFAAEEEQQDWRDSLRNKGHFTIAYRSNAAPFSFTDAKEKPAGYMIELCNHIASRLQQETAPKPLDINYLEVPMDRKLHVLENGSADLLCSATSDTGARREIANFSQPLFIAAIKILVKKDDNITGADDPKIKKVVVIAGTTAQELLQARADKTGWSVLVAQHEAAAFGQLKLGWAQAYVRDDVMLARQLPTVTHPEHYQILPDKLSEENISIATKLENTELMTFINNVIDEMAAENSINPIYKRWFEQPAPPSGNALNIPMSDELLKSLQTPT